jgi:predicted DNA-binding transcriptional regulator YafY
VATETELSERLSTIETAITRRKTIEFSYSSIADDEVESRKVDPYHLALPQRRILHDRPFT